MGPNLEQLASQFADQVPLPSLVDEHPCIFLSLMKNIFYKWISRQMLPALIPVRPQGLSSSSPHSLPLLISLQLTSPLVIPPSGHSQPLSSL
jgi:hypothetical protein